MFWTVKRLKSGSIDVATVLVTDVEPRAVIAVVTGGGDCAGLNF